MGHEICYYLIRKGDCVMSRYEEKTIALEAVKIVEEFGEMTMSELIAELTKRMRPTGHDNKILNGRKDTYFSQKVRNLRSHSNPIFFDNVVFDEEEGKYISKEYLKIKAQVSQKDYVEKLAKRKEKVITFYTRKLDYEKINKEKQEIGNKGELYVLNDQRKIIKQLNPKLVSKVRHVSKLDGDGAGYDIRSFNNEKEINYIEVKTTKGKKETPFYMSVTEFAFYELHRESYIIARVYNFDVNTGKGEIEYVKGNDFEASFEKEVSAYKLRYKIV